MVAIPKTFFYILFLVRRLVAIFVVTPCKTYHKLTLPLHHRLAQPKRRQAK